MRAFVFTCAVSALVAANASAQVILDLSTGWNTAHSALVPNFAADPNYTITGPGSGPFVAQSRNESSVTSTYVGDAAMPGSRWLYAVPSVAETGAFFVPGGNYFFRTNVDLTGYSPADAFLKDLKISSDNAFLQIRVNSAVVFSRPLPAPNPFIEEFKQVLTLPAQVGLGAFGPGINTVEFQVFNGPLAFRMLGGVAVPEPSSLLLVAAAAAILAKRKRRVT
jgi:hypothetical protein